VVLDLNVDGVATLDLDVVVGGRSVDQLTDDVKVNVKGGDHLHVQVKDHDHDHDHVNNYDSGNGYAVASGGRNRQPGNNVLAGGEVGQRWTSDGEIEGREDGALLDLDLGVAQGPRQMMDLGALDTAAGGFGVEAVALGQPVLEGVEQRLAGG
jgi:hypothetical protein